MVVSSLFMSIMTYPRVIFFLSTSHNVSFKLFRFCLISICITALVGGTRYSVDYLRHVQCVDFVFLFFVFDAGGTDY